MTVMKQRTRASVVCTHENKLLLVKLRDPSTGVVRLFPPGGKVEDNETPSMTAVRECLEETGVKVRVNRLKCLTDQYQFEWSGHIYSCTTTYFSATFIEQTNSIVQDVSYNEGLKWLPVEEVEKTLQFDKNIQKSVLALLSL